MNEERNSGFEVTPGLPWHFRILAEQLTPILDWLERRPGSTDDSDADNQAIAESIAGLPQATLNSILDAFKIAKGISDSSPVDNDAVKLSEIDNLIEKVEFTPREMDVLRILTKGHQNKIIAYQLDMSMSTVKTHMNSILRKLGVSNRTAAVSKVMEMMKERSGWENGSSGCEISAPDIRALNGSNPAHLPGAPSAP